MERAALVAFAQTLSVKSTKAEADGTGCPIIRCLKGYTDRGPWAHLLDRQQIVLVLLDCAALVLLVAPGEECPGRTRMGSKEPHFDEA